VDVDIYLTAFANARKYYDQKRATAAKHEKTIAASTKVRSDSFVYLRISCPLHHCLDMFDG
jgi:hypothetical protein